MSQEYEALSLNLGEVLCEFGCAAVQGQDSFDSVFDPSKDSFTGCQTSRGPI